MSNAVRSVLRKLGVTGYSIYGWRKNAGVTMAEAGCTPHEIAAILGHKTLQMVTHYTKRAGQKRQAKAAMERWESAESGKPKNKSAL